MIEHLSWSTLNGYSQCGEKIRLKKFTDAPEVPSWASAGGRAFHAATEALDLLDFGIDNEKPRTFVDAFHAEIEELQSKPDCPPSEEWYKSGPRGTKAEPEKNKAGYDWWIQYGPGMVNHWINWKNRSPLNIWVTSDGEPAIELAVEGDIGGHKVLAHIDIVMQDPITGAFVVVDKKTGARASDEGQLVTYSTLLDQKFPDLAGLFQWGTFFMARDGGNTPPVLLTDRPKQEYLYAETWRAIEAGIFLPKKSNLCGSCEVRRHCVFETGQDTTYAPFKSAV